MSTQQPISVYTISLPNDTKWESRRALQFTEQMLRSFHTLLFCIDATHDAIHHQIIDTPRQVSGAIETAIRASYPNATIAVSPYGAGQEPEQYPVYRSVLKYQQVVDTFLAPLLYVSDIKSPDPLTHVVEVMGNLRKGDDLYSK